MSGLNPVNVKKVFGSGNNPSQRQVKSADNTDPTLGPMTEEELQKKNHITPEDVLRLPKATVGFLCPPEANTYEIEFVRFKLRDMETGSTLFEVAKPEKCCSPGETLSSDSEEDLDQNAGRFVRYQFTPTFLKLKSIGALVEFTIGNQEVKSFRMIERHYFRDRLLKSFDFDFGFLIPGSKNTMEHIYEFPELEKGDIKLMVDNPYETRSDSYYFVDGKLVMHNKAEYSYNGSGDGF